MKTQGIFQAPYLPRQTSPPKIVHLLWALPIALSILLGTWWFQSSLWIWGGDFSQNQINMDLPNIFKNYVISALIAAIPILLANWSRRVWPRIALAVFLLVAQVVAGTWFILIPRESH